MTIILKKGANPNLQNKAGQTPLHILVQEVGNLSMVQCLFQYSKEAINLTLFDEATAYRPGVLAIDLCQSKDIKYYLKRMKSQGDKSLESQVVKAMSKTTTVKQRSPGSQQI